MQMFIYSNYNIKDAYPLCDFSKCYSGMFVYKYRNHTIKLSSYNIPDTIKSIYVSTHENNNKIVSNMYYSFLDAKNNIINNSTLSQSDIYYKYISSIPNNTITSISYNLNGIKYEYMIKEYMININKNDELFVVKEKLRTKLNSINDYVSKNINEHTAFDIYRICLDIKTKIISLK